MNTTKGKLIPYLAKYNFKIIDEILSISYLNWKETELNKNM